MDFVALTIIIVHLKKKKGAGESNWKLGYRWFPSEKRGLREATRKAGLFHVVLCQNGNCDPLFLTNDQDLEFRISD